MADKRDAQQLRDLLPFFAIAETIGTGGRSPGTTALQGEQIFRDAEKRKLEAEQRKRQANIDALNLKTSTSAFDKSVEDEKKRKNFSEGLDRISQFPKESQEEAFRNFAIENATTPSELYTFTKQPKVAKQTVAEQERAASLEAIKSFKLSNAYQKLDDEDKAFVSTVKGFNTFFADRFKDKDAQRKIDNSVKLQTEKDKAKKAEKTKDVLAVANTLNALGDIVKPRGPFIGTLFSAASNLGLHQTPGFGVLSEAVLGEDITKELDATRTLKDMRLGYASLYARAIGQDVGNLAEGDVKRAMAIMPKGDDTIPQREIKTKGVLIMNNQSLSTEQKRIAIDKLIFEELELSVDLNEKYIEEGFEDIRKDVTRPIEFTDESRTSIRMPNGEIISIQEAISRGIVEE